MFPSASGCPFVGGRGGAENAITGDVIFGTAGVPLLPNYTNTSPYVFIFTSFIVSDDRDVYQYIDLLFIFAFELNRKVNRLKRCSYWFVGSVMDISTREGSN